MGCTSGAPSESESLRTEVVREQLMSIWKTLPKTPEGRVEWRFVRYTAHRHFMHRFGVMVRGLEPTIQVNASNSGEADILNREAPALAKQLSSAKHGFSLQDAAVMIAALEQLLFDSDSVVLEKVYTKNQISMSDLISREKLQALIVDYIVYWMLGDDIEGAEILLAHRNMLDEHIPHWQAISTMVTGSVRTLEYSRQKAPRKGAAHTTFQGQYSFEDALEVAGDIGRNFAFFWESQCQDIKTSLLALDKTGSGRVRLPDFYGANKDGEWRFGECEEMMGYVEAAIGSPVGSVEDVLRVAENLTNGDDERAKLDDSLRTQLSKIAGNHGGKIPLHGRLFAQWLHYAFPSECPFPHVAGSAAALTPLQYGDNFAVSAEDVTKQLAEDAIKSDLDKQVNASAEQWQMSQWSE